MESIAEQIEELQQLVARAAVLQNNILTTLRQEEDRWRETKQRTNEALRITLSLKERQQWRSNRRQRMEERYMGRRYAFLRCFKPVTLNGQVVNGVALLPDNAVILMNGKEFKFLKQVQRTEKRIKPVDEALRFVLGQHDPEDICEKYINDFIGRGVFAKTMIRNGKFLAEYHGVLYKADEVNDKDTNYTYFFEFNGVNYCIDASEEPKPYQPSLGRLVNHADTKQQRNARMTVISVNGVPHLVLFATRDIQAEEEIRYDYGVKDLPWAIRQERKQNTIGNTDRNTKICLGEQGRKHLPQESTDSTKERNGIKQDRKQMEQNRAQQRIGIVRHEQDRKQIMLEIAGRDINSKRKENDEKHKTQKNTDHETNRKRDIQDMKTPKQESIGKETHRKRKDPDEKQQEQKKTELGTKKNRKEQDGKQQRNNTDQTLEVKWNKVYGYTSTQKSTLGEKERNNKEFHGKQPIHEHGDQNTEIENMKQDHENGMKKSIERDTKINRKAPSGNQTKQETEYRDEKEMWNEIDDTQPTHEGTDENTNGKKNKQNGLQSTQDSTHRQRARKCKVQDWDQQTNKNGNREREQRWTEHGWKHKVQNIIRPDTEKIEKITDGKQPSQGIEVGDTDRNGTNQAKANSDQESDNNFSDGNAAADELVCSKEDGSEMSNGNESYLDDSDADPDYVASGSEESDDFNDNRGRHKNGENVDYVSDSDCSNIIPVQHFSAFGEASTSAACEPFEKRYQKSDGTHDPSTSNEQVQKALIQSTTAYRENGQRNVDKKHFCVFCGKYHLRIGRHLQTHTEEMEIQMLKAKNKIEKEKVLTKLRLDGDYKHNLKVRETGIGYLILPRRPSDKDAKKYTFQDYKPCEVCKGFYLRWELWRHMPNCPLATDDQRRNIKSPSRTMWQQRSNLMLEASMSSNKTHTCSKTFTDKIVSTLNTDEISLVARNDSIIMKLGEQEFDQKGVQQKKSIKQKMRLLGRLVLKMRKITYQENAYLDHFLKSNMFDFFIDAAKELSGIYEGKMASSFKTPSVASKLGPLLRECCAIIKGRYNRSGDEVMLQSVQRLTTLIDDEWDKKVSAIARRSRQEHRRNKQVQLPKASDLALLNDHLDQELPKAESALLNFKGDNEKFQRLSTLILTKIIVFNRRRSGEASQIFLSDYLQKPDWHNTLNDVIMKQLSVLERKLVHRLDMLMIRGKTERNVAVILTPEITRALNQLSECREHVGISRDNPYLFPRSSGLEHIEGHVCLRSLTSEIEELEYPERIYSTSLRKFTATIVQMLNLNSGELEWLSYHLGHTVDVHKEYYRNQESAVEMGKIASMLMRLDRSMCTENDSDSEEETDILEALSDEHLDPIKRKESSTSNDLAYNENCDTVPIKPPVERRAGEYQRKVSSSIGPENNNSAITSASKRKAEFPVKPGKKTKVVPWTEEQLAAMRRAFAKNLRCLTVPNKEECERARKNESVLQFRDWKNIKFRVHHEIQRLKKK